MENWVINTDYDAEMALKRVKKAGDERERLLALVSMEEEELRSKRQEIDTRFNYVLDNAKYYLEQFMDNVDKDKKHFGKTIEKYKLLSGEITRTLPKKELKYDEGKLIANKDFEKFVEYKPNFKWGELKKSLVVDGDKIINEDGEVIEVDGLYLEDNKIELKIKIKE